MFIEITQQHAINFGIIGDGFSIRRSTNAPATPADLLRVSGSGAGRFAAIDVGFHVGPADTAAVRLLDIDSAFFTSSVTPTAAGSTATGIIVEAGTAQLDIQESLIDGLPIGVDMDGQTLSISRSTITSTQVDLDLALADDDVSSVDNSTLGGPTGLRLAGGVIGFTSSTVLGDGGTQLGNTNIAVLYRSSIVSSCTLNLATGSFPPDVAPTETNVGGCFNPGDIIATDLADNGCERATPEGCPKTAAISAFSPARDIGACEAPHIDQRGQSRGQPPCDAGAFEWMPAPECLDQSQPPQPRYSFNASTAEEFNQAISCFNEADLGLGRFEIHLDATIEATSVTSTAVFPAFAPRTLEALTIIGNGNTLRRGPAAPPATLPLLSFAMSNAQIELRDLHIEVGEFDTHGILSASDDRVDLSVYRTSIAATVNNSDATGISAMHSFGDLTIDASIIDGLSIGMQLRADFASVLRSSLTSTSADVVSTEPGFLVISISTLTAPTAVQAEAATVFIAGSTIVGDGAAGSPTADAIFRISSSIVGSCSAPVALDDLPTSVIVDDGGNVGGCFFPGQSMDTALADNGCRSSTPTGCSETIALGPDAPARGAGFCGETPGGAISIDQRGFPRSPIGAGCDAGAYEDLGCDQDPADFTASNEGELNVAIVCFNLATDGPLEHVVTLTNEIVLTQPFLPTPGDIPDFFEPRLGFWPVDQERSDARLVIEGNGMTVRSASNVDGLFHTTEQNRGALVVDNLHVVSDLVRDSIALLDGSGPTTIRNSAVTSDGVNKANIAIDGGPGALVIENSLIEGESNGIFGGTGPVTVTASTVSGSAAISVRASSNLLVENSTVGGRFAAISLSSHTTGMVRNTTINTASGIYADFNDPSDLQVVSSYFTGECPQAVVLGPGNAGLCLDGINDGFSLPLTDNGCSVPTPIGCVPTAALPVDSPALGAGLCDDIDTDQRGEPRTPAGPGCDAGAFELAGFVAPELGDVNANGAVDNADVQALLAYLAGGDDPPGLIVADVNDDGQIRLDDALLLAQQIEAG